MTSFQTIATTMAVLFVDKVGRRFLLVMSYMVMTLSYVPVAFYFNINELGLLCNYIDGKYTVQLHTVFDMLLGA